VTFDFGEEEFVLEKIGVGEVEFDLESLAQITKCPLLGCTHLFSDCYGVAAFLLRGKVRLDIIFPIR
jgi:hypothetical protein